MKNNPFAKSNVKRVTLENLKEFKPYLRNKNTMYLIKYRHDDCKVKPGVEWEDEWDCACNGECPECGEKDIEPCDYDELNENGKNDTKIM